MKDGFWVAKKRVPKIVVLFIGWKKKGCVFCGGNVGKGMIEVDQRRQIVFFYKRMVGCLFFPSSHHTGRHMTLTQLFPALDRIFCKVLS